MRVWLEWERHRDEWRPRDERDDVPIRVRVVRRSREMTDDERCRVFRSWLRNRGRHYSAIR